MEPIDHVEIASTEDGPSVYEDDILAKMFGDNYCPGCAYPIDDCDCDDLYS